jgi:ATP-dependent helicase/nuclease subunit B
LPEAQTLQNLGALHAKEILSTSSQNSSLARLGVHLFSAAVPPEGKSDDEVMFFSAPGEERECVEIARRILAEVRKGIPFDQIAILLRAPENYGSLMERWSS